MNIILSIMHFSVINVYKALKMYEIYSNGNQKHLIPPNFRLLLLNKNR